MDKEVRFDEGFDNILVYDYDAAYKQGSLITSQSLIETCSRTKISLDGDWHFCPDVFHSVIRSRWFDETKYNCDHLPIPYDFTFEECETISVPGVWISQKKEYALYEGAGLYFKEFDYVNYGLQRQMLRIGAANYETRIWLNGQYLGRHLGGFTPFCIDVTESLKEHNRLLISVDNTRKGEQIPSLHYDWFNYGGIHRTIEIVETPNVFVKDFYIQLSKNEKNQIDYQISVVSNSLQYSQDSIDAELYIEALDIMEPVICRKISDNQGWHYEGNGKLSIEENLVDLWSPETPSLYSVEVRCLKDSLEDKIGFRRIEVQGREIRLNGEPIFLKGMCVHEESPEHLRAMTVEDIKDTLETAKELGCNFLRLTHYPHSELTAKYADELGIMLLEEIPVYWALEFDNSQTFEDASNQLKELIMRDRNRASVVIWSVGNENPDSDARYHFMCKLVDVAKGLDKNRLIGASCLIDVEQCIIKDRLISRLDVVGINEYYGWYIKDFTVLEKILNSYHQDKPVIITETGADAVCGMFGDEDEIYTEECQALVYKKQFEILLKYSFIKGITPWILFDYKSMRRMSHLQKGYNLKGIISADRTYRKKAYDVVKEVYHRNKI